MSGGVTWVAVAALILSVVSLAWQVWNALHRAPRIRIGLRRDYYEEHDYSDAVDELDEGILVGRVRFRLTVQNNGAEPVSVYDVGLVRPGYRIPISGLSNNWVPGLGHGPSRQLNDVWSGEKLPIEVPGRGIREWTVEDPATNRFDNGLEWQAYVEQYRAGKKPKEIRSKERHSRLA